MTYWKPYTDNDITIPATVTEDIFHYASHQGIAFSASAQGTADLWIVFTTGAVNPFHMLWTFGGIGASRLNIIEGCTAAAGGSDQIVYSSNRELTMNGGATSSCLAGNTGTVGSVQVGIAATGGVQINPQGFFIPKNTGGVDTNAAKEMIMKLNTTYMFHLQELSSSAQNGITLSWFEVPIAP